MSDRSHLLLTSGALAVLLMVVYADPLWTEPGWNLHTAAEVCIDSFQADRAPDHTYKTINLNGLFVRERGLFMNPANKGRFYHDGRFATLHDVVEHYDRCKSLALSDGEGAARPIGSPSTTGPASCTVAGAGLGGPASFSVPSAARTRVGVPSCS